MKNTIAQWNCRGSRANYDELQILLNDYDPAVVSLQEIYLKEPNHVTLRNYNLFNTFAVGDGRSTGGVAIIINNKCPRSQIRLKTNIQAVAVSVTLYRTVSICKGKSTSVNHLKKNDDNITSKKDIANSLADCFSKNSSSENYTSKFRNIKNQQEKQKLKFTLDNNENSETQNFFFLN